jgi:hypothetical protein
MNLKSALKGVLSVLTKDKTKSVFNKIRFVENPSGVFVTDGICSSFIYVDSPLMDCLVDANVVSEAVKDKGELLLSSFDQIGKVCLRNEYNVYYLNCLADPYPLPIYPKSEYNFIAMDVCKLNNIIFSASKTSKANGFPYIHFTKNYIETTDGNRLVRLDNISFPYDDVVVPIELFNKWPKKIRCGAVYRDDYFLYFMLGEEIRTVILSDRKFPNTATATKYNNTYSSIVNRKQLMDVIKQASNISEIKGVSFDIKDRNIGIKALGVGSVSDSYIGNVDIIEGCSELLFNVGINGVLLHQCLSHIKSDEIELIYNKYPSPLIIKGDDTTMYIWPLINE